MEIVGVSAEVTSSDQSFWMHVVTGDGQQQRVPLIAEQFELISEYLQAKPAPRQQAQSLHPQPQPYPDQAQYQDDVFARPMVSQQTQIAQASRQRSSGGLEQMVDVLRQQSTTVISQVPDDDAAPIDYGEVSLRGGLGNVPQI